MIRKRIAPLDDKTIYRLIVAELLPFSKKTMPGLTVNPKMIKRHLNRNITFVAARGQSAPFGFVSFRASGDSLFVDMLAVDRKAQNRGLGAQLMACAERYGVHNGCTRVSLYVDDANQKAIRFYNRLGFSFETYVPAYRCYLLGKQMIGASFL
jgi:ribosomal protein S18 acetylase RimI-like enzyme